MAFVIVDGAGTYTVGDHTFKPGANPCDDPAVLDAVSRARLEWVYVQLDRSVATVEAPPEPEEVVEDEPYVVFLGRDGKFYYVDGLTGQQSPSYDEETIAVARAEMAKAEAGKIPLAGDTDPNSQNGELTKEELDQTEFPCQEPGCQKVFSDSGARENHERIQKHGVHNPNAA